MESREVKIARRKIEQKRDWWIITIYTILALSYFSTSNARPNINLKTKITGKIVSCLGLVGVVLRESSNILIVHLTNATKPTLFGRNECEVIK
jgi:hypothetical protein